MRILSGMLPVIGLVLYSGVALAGPDCTCRFAGADFSIGTCTCVTIGGKQKLACCDMVLNNTSWKFGEGGCPVADGPAGDGHPDVADRDAGTSGKKSTQQASLPPVQASPVK